MYADIDELELKDDVGVNEAIMERGRMIARTEVNYSSNKYAIIVNLVAVLGLLIMLALHLFEQVEAVEWMALFLLPYPIFLFLHHFSSMRSLQVRRKWWR